MPQVMARCRDLTEEEKLERQIMQEEVGFLGIHGIERRSIPLSVILTIVTCGLYGLYWIIKLNDEINQLAGEPNATSSGMVILLSIVTCGIYEFYWLYKMGERGDKIKGVNSSSGILYIVIAILGLSIVDLCLIQDTVNKKVGN